MNEFYDYIAALSPEPEIRADKRKIKRCQQAVLAEMHPKKPAVRRSLRIALLASVALLAVTSVPIFNAGADRPAWQETYDFIEPLPAEQLDADMEAVREITQYTALSCQTDGFTLTLDSYATDGLAGIAFLTLTVPEDFDWQYPYLGIPQQTLIENSMDISVGISTLFSDASLTPTDQPNQYRAEIRFRVNNPCRHPDDLERILILQSIELRDEYYDFADKTRFYVGSGNPHRIVFEPAFAFQLRMNDLQRTQSDDRLGNICVTPFGVYLWSQNWQDMALRGTHPEILLPDGIWHDFGDRPYTFIFTWNNRARDADTESDCGAIFAHPVDLNKAIAFRFADSEGSGTEIALE